KRPWPAMARTIFNDPDRFVKQYWSDIPGMYFTGDGARRDADGYYWLMGRVDDVLNVSGHRLGTMEVESALVAHPKVAEAAVVGRPDDLKGQAICAFVTLEHGNTVSDRLEQEPVDVQTWFDRMDRIGRLEDDVVRAIRKNVPQQKRPELDKFFR